MKFRTSLKYFKLLALLIIVSIIYQFVDYKEESTGEGTSTQSQIVFKTIINDTEKTKIVFNLKPVEKSAVLFLSVIAGKNSFGSSRTFVDFLGMIEKQCSPDNADYTLGLLISSQDLFDLIVPFIESATPPIFSRITLILDHRQPTERTHAKDKQTDRRRFIATLRNTLVYSSMAGEEYILWIDSDIVSIPSGMLNTMIESKKDIITPACRAGRWIDYDGNAWKGSRTKPSQYQIEQMQSSGRSDFVPEGVAGKLKHVSELQGSEKFVEIDSVGGTMLFSKSEIFRRGINFPPYYVIGADWDRLEGWDGIETEGLCFVAKAVGYQCWAMPNDFVEHA